MVSYINKNKFIEVLPENMVKKHTFDDIFLSTE